MMRRIQKSQTSHTNQVTLPACGWILSPAFCPSILPTASVASWTLDIMRKTKIKRKSQRSSLMTCPPLDPPPSAAISSPDWACHQSPPAKWPCSLRKVMAWTLLTSKLARPQPRQGPGHLSIRVSEGEGPYKVRLGDCIRLSSWRCAAEVQRWVALSYSGTWET